MNNFIDEINRWLPFLGGIATLLWPFILFQLSKRFVGKAEYESMKTAQGEVVARLEELERRMETVPDGKTMHVIQLSLEEMRGDVKALDASMDGIETSISGLREQISMLVQHHLENSR